MQVVIDLLLVWTPFLFIFLVIPGLIILSLSKATVSNSTTSSYKAKLLKDWSSEKTLKVVEDIKRYDATFDAEVFLTFAAQLYTEYQLALHSGNTGLLRCLLQKEFYNTVMSQLQEQNKQRVEYRYTDIQPDCAYLTNYVREGAFEYLTVRIQAPMLPYQGNDLTGNKKRGTLEYEMRFRRLIPDAWRPRFCPKCDAVLSSQTRGKCTSCGIDVMDVKREWFLIDFVLSNDKVQNNSIHLFLKDVLHKYNGVDD